MGFMAFYRMHLSETLKRSTSLHRIEHYNICKVPISDLDHNQNIILVKLNLKDISNQMTEKKNVILRKQIVHWWTKVSNNYLSFVGPIVTQSFPSKLCTDL